MQLHTAQNAFDTFSALTLLSAAQRLRQSAVNCAKTAEPIEMSFETWTRLGPRKYVLDRGAHWLNLSNTIEPSHPSVAAGAAFMSNHCDHLFLLVHGQVTIIFVVSVGLSVCLFVQSFSQPSLIRFRSN